MKETIWAQTSSLPPPPPASLPPSCQVMAVQQNKVNHSPTRAFSSTNEGVLPCTNKCVRVFACSHEPIIHHACSQTSFRSRLLPNSGEPLLCVHVDVHAVCLCLPPLQSFAALWRLSPAAVCQGVSIDITLCCLLDAQKQLFLQIYPELSLQFLYLMYAQNSPPRKKISHWAYELCSSRLLIIAAKTTLIRHFVKLTQKLDENYMWRLLSQHYYTLYSWSRPISLRHCKLKANENMHRLYTVAFYCSDWQEPSPSHTFRSNIM